MYLVKVEWMNDEGIPFNIEGTVPELPSPGKLLIVTCPHYNGLPKQFIEMELGYVEEVSNLHHVYNILTRENCYDMTVLKFKGPLPANVIDLQAIKRADKIKKMIPLLKSLGKDSDTLH